MQLLANPADVAAAGELPGGLARRYLQLSAPAQLIGDALGQW